MDDKAEKIALFRYGLIAPLVLETLPRGELTRRAQEIAARLYDIPHSTRRQVSVDTLLDWTLRYRRNGLAALSPKPRQDRGQAARHRAGNRRAHRTAQAREPASHRGRSAARVGPGQRAEPGRPVGLHALSFPARPRPHRTPTAARQSHRAQKVRSPVRQSDLAVRHAVRPLGRSGPAAARAGLPAGHARRRQPPHPARAVLSQPGTGFLSGLPAPSHRRPRHSHPPLHGQRQDLPLAAVGPHRRLHRHPHHPHAALSARRPRQDRALLPFRARAVSGLTRSQGSAVARAVERALVALARHRLSPPRAQRSADHAAAALAARHRTGPPTSAGHRFTPSVLSSRGPAGAPRFHFPAAESFLRSAARIWPANASKCASIRSISRNWRSTREGKPEGVARLVDAVVNGLLPPWETEEK